MDGLLADAERERERERERMYETLTGTTKTAILP